MAVWTLVTIFFIFWFITRLFDFMEEGYVFTSGTIALLTTIFTTILSIEGAIVGFYFQSRKNRDNNIVDLKKLNQTLENGDLGESNLDNK